MSSDGAHAGIGAMDAMKAVIGGEQPTRAETAQEMGIRLQQMMRPDPSNWTYDSVASYMAAIILRAFQADPTLAQAPTENEYAKDVHGRTIFEPNMIVEREGLYDVLMKSSESCLSPEDYQWVKDSGLSGFQWGWAVNAARRCVELPSVPNPAIVTI